MELIKQGAEAKLYKARYLGTDVLIKDRIPKTYRNAKLDEKIRALRTRDECTLLHRAKQLGVRTPVIYKVDKGGKRIFMEFVEGKRLKDVLDRENLRLCRAVGEAIGKLHRADLIHGDLTTSNIVLKGDTLIFVDFGLGFNSAKAEDKAVDLLVFKKTFAATHFALPRGWEMIIEGYLQEYPQGKSIVERIAVVEARVRYH
jgi:Kae1-associated kinase Bud32